MTLQAWLTGENMTYRQASQVTGLSVATIGHVVTECRAVSFETARKLDTLGLPKEVKVWVARRQVRREREALANIERWKRWCSDDLPPEDD